MSSGSLFSKAAEIAGVTGGELAVPGERAVGSVGTDSRVLQDGALFVALPGKRVDGHDFLGEALGRGAAALLVAAERPQGRQVAAEARRRAAAVIRVGDTLKALQELGRYHLGRLPGVFRLGVTGSSGKTTTKELLGGVLRRQAPTATSRGNLNSEIGLPLACFEVGGQHRFAVFEMGVDHPGEMSVLADIVRPDLAVITNIGSAHLEAFGSRESIAREKGQIFRHFDGRQKVFLYEDDPFFPFLSREARGRVVPFGARGTRGYEGSEDLGLDGTVIRWEGLRIRFPLFGFHNLLNALAALSVAAELGVQRSNIRDGLEAAEPLFGRSQILRGEVTVLQDCYNANPGSLGRLLEFLAALRWSGRKLAVLGSMKELGAETESAHRQAGRLAASSGLDGVFLFGEEMEAACQELRAAAPERLLLWTTEFGLLRREVQRSLRPGDLLVLKGSRAMELERLLPDLAVGVRT
jgi:UDP-N-acetylmuramoyl-tripeptide--D-alanyl-D-alanine ligase